MITHFSWTNPAHSSLSLLFITWYPHYWIRSNESSTCKQHLDKCFGIKDLGKLHYFLGLEMFYLPQGIVLNQKKFTTELLKDCDMKIATPLPLNCKLLPNEGALIFDSTCYRTLMGRLNFQSNPIPNLSFTVHILNQLMQQLRTTHLQALHHK